MTSSDHYFATPMMQQYQKLKAEHHDCILLFRLGDFYEMFLEDAELGARILGITLTSRARGKDGRIPMAGVPHHALDNYLSKLVKSGYKVAICEQVGDVATGKLVERQVVRIVTPGTLLTDSSSLSKSNNYVLSIALGSKNVGVAAADISTGFFAGGQFNHKKDEETIAIITSLLTRLKPSECLVSPSIDQDLPQLNAVLARQGVHLTLVSDWDQQTQNSAVLLKKHFQVKSLQALKINNQASLQQAAAALLSYFYRTQQSSINHITSLKPLFQENYLILDQATITNLELLTTISENENNGSLLSFLDETTTSSGSRLLKEWLLKPLISKKEIENRFAFVESFVGNRQLLSKMRDHLKKTYDIERILSKAAVNLATPRDLKNLERSLVTIINLYQLLSSPKLSTSLLKKTANSLHPKIVAKVAEKLSQTLVEEPPVDPKAGGLIQTKTSLQIDQLNQVISNNREWMVNLEQSEKSKTGISSLKIRFNKVFGFYIEVSKSFVDQVPNHYIRRQTLVNAERYITSEMKKREDLILAAEEKVKELEYQVFKELVEFVLKEVKQLQEVAQLLAKLDCLSSFAQLAINQQLVKPKITTDGRLKITDGRHPVVEQSLFPKKFVPNSVELTLKNEQVMIITGPNMAGKSVLMRQVALITLLAHLGSFVPAGQASISIVDSIFVRSGARDSIASGLSTFMVEMVETAHILTNVTDKSLVIMDEIGRGTSTYDGISIAWAVAEQLVSKKGAMPKTLFATHYHELQELAEKFPNKIRNFHMAIASSQDKPTFLYSLKEGKSSHSYGVAVAQMAGIPQQVTTKARQLLERLERNHQPISLTGESVLTDISPTTQAQNQTLDRELLEELKKLEVATTTPLEALKLLHQWQLRLKVRAD